MPTTKDDILRWIGDAKDQKSRWLVVACDTFDHGDYPIYFSENEFCECRKKIESLQKGENMQKLMEVYDLKKPLEDQINARRAMEIPVNDFLTQLAKDTEPQIAETPIDLGVNWPTVGEVRASMKRKPRSSIDIIKDQLDPLTDDQRKEIFSNYCKYCGSKDTGCQCWNDS